MNRKNKYFWPDSSVIPLIFGAIITLLGIYFMYGKTEELLTERLREKLSAIAATAALQFNSTELNSIKGKGNMSSENFKAVIRKLNNIREVNQNIRYIYIFRKTNDPTVLEFVADADMLASLEELDANKNNIVDEDEAPPVPGDQYDVKNLPPGNASELMNGFDHSTATRILGSDKWGSYLSGFAPVRDGSAQTVGVLGIDVAQDDFYQIVRGALGPLLLLALLLLILLTVQTIALVRIWNSRLDEIKEVDRQKDELLGIVSHQLLSPITSLRWYLEVLQDDIESIRNPTQKESLQAMYGIADTLTELVSMILDVSRIQLGKVRLEPQPLQVDELLKEIYSVIDPKVNEKNINFVKIVQNPLPSLLLDKKYTRMIIENLLTNAIKYTSSGGTVTLRLYIKEDILFGEVEDTGCGIPKAEQGKIFQKLFRASNVRNEKDGNGFGLYVAKGAVEAQGGNIWFRSEEGKGSIFGFELPILLKR